MRSGRKDVARVTDTDMGWIAEWRGQGRRIRVGTWHHPDTPNCRWGKVLNNRTWVVRRREADELTTPKCKICAGWMAIEKLRE